jgi:hypothetical protein
MKSISWRTEWITAKCEIAIALHKGVAGGGYAEAAILLSSAITALASEIWPGKAQDRTRFIELLVRMSPPTPSLATISVPLLMQHLKTSNPAVARQLEIKLLDFGSSLVVTGLDVDRLEADLAAIVPTIPLKVMRKHSYACLIYEELRSSYAHDYRPGEKADSWPMTILPNQAISYVNKMTERRIHFHIDWLAGITIEIAKQVDSISAKLPLPCPLTWWISEHP